MKPKNKKSKDLVKIPEPELLHLVSEKLKDRELFPKKVEAARKYLKNIKITTR